MARNANPLQPKRSVLHAVVGDVLHPYHPEVYYAHERSAMATEFTEAGVGIIPVATAWVSIHSVW